MRLVLIRHGRTGANERRLYCGATDVSLSDEGRSLLAGLKETVKYPPVDGMTKITTGLRRTDETLRILFGTEADACIPELQEMDFGRFEMHSYEQLREDADYQAWITDETGDVSTPGGESANLFRQRVFAAVDRIYGDAVIVCHGGVIAALMARWFPEEGKSMYQWQPEGGLGYVVDFQGDELQWRAIGPEEEKKDC